MELRLKRRYFRTDYTIGTLYIDTQRFCDTLEDKVREIGPDGKGKVPGETAVSYGRFKVILTYSPKFGRVLPLLVGVPFFEGIRMHRGATHRDTAGCILVGENTSTGKLINSGYFENKLVEILKLAEERGEEVYITIEK